MEASQTKSPKALKVQGHHSNGRGGSKLSNLFHKTNKEPAKTFKILQNVIVWHERYYLQE